MSKQIYGRRQFFTSSLIKSGSSTFECRREWAFFFFFFFFASVFLFSHRQGFSGIRNQRMLLWIRGKTFNFSSSLNYDFSVIDKLSQLVCEWKNLFSNSTFQFHFLLIAVTASIPVKRLFVVVSFFLLFFLQGRSASTTFSRNQGRSKAENLVDVKDFSFWELDFVISPSM